MDHDPLVARDRRAVWHPYAPPVAGPLFAVESARGALLRLTDGRELVDGMSSWWSAIHGYRHPRIEAAVRSQLERLPHVMFGGLTHEPAVALSERLQLPDRRLDLMMILYTHQLDIDVQAHLAYCHQVSFWTWKSAELVDLEANFERFERLVPNHQRFLGCYLWDFGVKGAPIAELELLQRQCELGREWLRRGRLKTAVGQFEEALRLSPLNPEALRTLGRLHYRRREHEAARRFLVQAREVAPPTVRLLVRETAPAARGTAPPAAPPS